jgi:hypothetical protein
LTECLAFLRRIHTRQPDPSLFAADEHGNRVTVHDADNSAGEFPGYYTTGDRYGEKTNAE